MKLTLEQFETQFADNNLSVTDWFDTTYGLFKELEALDRSRREWYQKGYAEAEYECKAKDEEIHYLKTQMTGWSMMFDEPQDAKARSIVAMLFWMMKRQKAIYVKSFNDLGINNHNTSFYKGAYENSKMRFKQAYKMLKDIK